MYKLFESWNRAIITCTRACLNDFARSRSSYARLVRGKGTAFKFGRGTKLATVTGSRWKGGHVALSKPPASLYIYTYTHTAISLHRSFGREGKRRERDAIFEEKLDRGAEKQPWTTTRGDIERSLITDADKVQAHVCVWRTNGVAEGHATPSPPSLQ